MIQTIFILKLLNNILCGVILDFYINPTDPVNSN